MKPFFASNTVMKKVFVLTILIGVVSLTQILHAEPYDAYLMAHFTGESSNYGEQIYFAISTDGLNWRDLNSSQPILTANIGDGGVRDPSLIRSADGSKFWILATDLCIGCGTDWGTAQHNGSTSLVIWESTDLIDWSEPWLADVAGGIPDAGCAWAPEAIYDEENSNYVVYWATISTLDEINKPRMYYATTTDFVNFSAPQMYINRPGSEGIIDTQILKVTDGGSYQYYRASRDDGNITIEASNSILDLSWDYIGNITGLVSIAVEGPILYKFNDVNEWGLLVDQYSTGGGYLPLVTDDLSDMSEYRVLGSSEYSLGASRKRHGSILNLTAAEYNAILNEWPLPTMYPGDVIESYDYSGYFFNHEGGNQATIVEDANGLDSGQWNIVPGLADSAGISFESVEYPGSYLRHYGFVLYLHGFESTTIYREDATYYVRDGWADTSLASFESYNYPGRYIRHSGFGLRVDEVDSGSLSSLKGDATFDIKMTPPAVPASLTAISGIGEVSLDWDDNVERDLDRYSVHRSETSGGPYTFIQDVTASEYLDNSVSNGTLYYYFVTATDTSANVSGNSNEDSALPPDLTDDGKINLEDIAKIAEAWLTNYDINDLLKIAENWLHY